MFISRKLFVAPFLFALMCMTSTVALAQDEAEESVNPNDRAAVEAARRLSSSDPLLRQQAAEELARLSANDQQKLVQGYFIQEKDKSVKLALAWALYRMGKSEMLFAVVRDLDSSRADQASGYLQTMDAPEPLYMFLKSSTNRRTQMELLKVLGVIGNQGTLEQVQPFADSPDAKVSRAAELATRAISERLAQAPSETPTRPRQVGTTTPEDSP